MRGPVYTAAVGPGSGTAAPPVAGGATTYRIRWPAAAPDKLTVRVSVNGPDARENPTRSGRKSVVAPPLRAPGVGVRK